MFVKVTRKLGNELVPYREEGPGTAVKTTFTSSLRPALINEGISDTAVLRSLSNTNKINI
jgi:hypothetical protein